MKKVIFDLDGTLALIDNRRASSTMSNGKINWSIFFDPKNINKDLPNQAVIDIAKLLKSTGHEIIIFSGRSGSTEDATKDWLNKFDVPFDILKMRPVGTPSSFMPDHKLKKQWFDDLFPTQSDVSEILCVFDDRDSVVKMWRDLGLVCMQVAPGDF